METILGGTVRLTELTTCGGCAAKWGASLLQELVGDVVEAMPSGDDRILVGLSPSDDAAVVRITQDVALVTTTDFFPPLVDDPADYGAIAAANACSDVFAMGGEVVVALNLAALPESLPVDVIRTIFRAAADVVAEAGGVVAGGHTIRSEEPIFGLAVQGVVSPGDEFTKSGARPGDVLVLSKPLGTGLALASNDQGAAAAATTSMRRLNRRSAEALRHLRAGVHAVTDITGFGLLGHAWEVAERSGVSIRFEASALPLLPGVAAAAKAGVRTGGDARNRSYLRGRVSVEADEVAAAIGFDPQTSGGLLAAVDSGIVDELFTEGFVPVGQVIAGPDVVELR